MISLTRVPFPEELHNTHERFLKVTRENSKAEKYKIYIENKSRYKYNTPETKAAFEVMNSKRCTFCGKLISDYNSEMTIEHIELKKDNPEKIFLWNNLLLSCRTCNTKRSIKKYNKSLYIDPTILVDTERYFSYYIDGTIVANCEISIEEQKKANYMIKLYALNRSDLRREREMFIIDCSTAEMRDVAKSVDKNNPFIRCIGLYYEFMKDEIKDREVINEKI